MTDLAFLCSKAAIELDNFRLGKESKFESVLELADYFDYKITYENNKYLYHKLDSFFMHVVWLSLPVDTRAITHNMEQLVHEADLIGCRLRKTAKEPKLEHAISLRDFCVQLSKSVMRQEAQLRG